MAGIFKITGSAEGTKVTGSFGRIYALTPVDVTITSSLLGKDRITLTEGSSITDTTVEEYCYNSIQEVIVWGQGVVLLQEGIPSIIPTPPTPIVSGSFIINGLSLTQAQIEGLLTAETFVGYTSSISPTFTQYTSSTNYSINNGAFNTLFANRVGITSYLDNGGYNTSIGSNAFNNTPNLKEVYFPNTTTIGDNCFAFSAIETASFNELTAIPFGAFQNALSLKSISCPKVTTIGQQAFWSVNIPGMNLATASFPLCTSVGPFSFKTTDLTDLQSSFPVLQTIDSNAFSQMDFLVTASNNSVTNIGDSGFIDNPKLRIVNFPNCNNISSFVFNASTTVFYPSGTGSIVEVNLPSLIAPNGLGGGTGNNQCFGPGFGSGINVPLSGSGTFPSAFSASNAGNPDGDIAYLIGRGWTINWV
jgi:hypothetical protein